MSGSDAPGSAQPGDAEARSAGHVDESSDAHGTAADQGPPIDLERERTLLIEALTRTLGASFGAAGPGSGAAGHPGAATETVGNEQDAPQADGNDGSGTHPLGGPDESAQWPAADEAAIGCACCGCKSPRTCSYCPLCRGAGAALDPQLLEGVADVAVLLSEGLRAAARRMATRNDQDGQDGQDVDERDGR